MRLGLKNRTLSGRDPAILWGLIPAIALILIPMTEAHPSVINMPAPLPDIVKSYKSVTVKAGVPGMHPTGVRVVRGDSITILATGMIDLSRGLGEGYIYRPNGLLLFLLRQNDRLREYLGPEVIEIKEDGEVYLGYRGSRMSPDGTSLTPQAFSDDSGSFSVDIIVWRTNDPDLVLKFLRQAPRSQPGDTNPETIAQEFEKRQKEIAALARKRAAGEKEGKQELPNSTTPVVKMPSPLPDIIKSYKSVTLQAKRTGMLNTGVQMLRGDIVTMLAQGTINLSPERGLELARGPRRILLFRFGNNESARYFDGPQAVEAPEDGALYLGYESSVIYFSGEPVKPKNFGNDIGAFTVDIIVWKTKDPNLIVKFFEDLGSARNETALRGVAKELRDRQDRSKEEEAKKIQRGLQAIKELEDLKKERSKPVIVVASPKDGTTVDSEFVNLYGMVEHDQGISRFEITINDKPIELKDQRGLQIAPRDRKTIEFSERVRLTEGENRISLTAQSTEGITVQRTLSVQLAKKRQEVYAVVIGINRYKNRSLPPLKYASNDAREFYRYLVEENQVPKDHVWLLLDEEATLDRLRTTLGTLLRRSAGKDDTVIIFLAGHGATEQDPSSPDGDGLEKYILPYNADPKDLYATSMPMSEIARIFQRINSERLVFISDTCYSGASGGRTILSPGRRVTVSGAFLDRLSQGKGRVILTASAANEVSVERDDLKHGVFTYYLLEGLRGQADLDKDGVVTVDEVYRYISMMVPHATKQSQHPVRKGETTGDIILGTVK